MFTQVRTFDAVAGTYEEFTRTPIARLMRRAFRHEEVKPCLFLRL